MQGKENKMDENTLKENYIFLSYSHENRGIVNTIANKIENDGYCVWYDKIETFVTIYLSIKMSYIRLLVLQQIHQVKNSLRYVRD